MAVAGDAAPLTGALASHGQIDQLLEALVELTGHVLAADKCSLMLLLPTTGELVIRKALGLSDAVVKQTRVKLGDGIAGWVALHRRPILAEDAYAVPDLERRYAAKYATQSFASTPILAGTLLGVLSAADKHDGGRFDHRDLRLLQQMASLLGRLLSVQAIVDVLQQTDLKDPLTGLGNRRYFVQRLRQELARASRYGHPVSLVMIDIDHFNQVDDYYGHSIANRLLQRLGSSIERLIRRSDVAVRYAGDEFAIILAQTKADGAESAAERLIDTIAQESLPDTPEGPPNLELSAGISCYPDLANSEEQLINQATAALHNAKSGPARHIQTWHEPTDRLLEAQRSGIPFLAAPVEMLTPEIAGLIPIAVARRHCCVPVGHKRGKLTVAMLDPTDGDLLQTVARATHLTIHPVISNRAEIITALGRLSELWHKVAAAEIIVRKIPGRGRELKIVLEPLTARADLEPVMLELVDTCRSCQAPIRTVEGYVMVVTASAIVCSRLLKALRQIDDLLIESVRIEYARRFQFGSEARARPHRSTIDATYATEVVVASSGEVQTSAPADDWLQPT